MSKEKDIVVSGVMFLVALQAYSRLSILASGKIMGVCSPTLRFLNSLFAAVLVAAISLSFTISLFYFKSFSHKVCQPLIDGEDGTEEDNDGE